MHSYTLVVFDQEVVARYVLILVVMEDALVLCCNLV